MPAETDRHERTLMAWPTVAMAEIGLWGDAGLDGRARGVRRDRARDRARTSRSRWSRRRPTRDVGRQRVRTRRRGGRAPDRRLVDARHRPDRRDGRRRQPARAALPVQRVGREVVAVGRRRGGGCRDRRRTSGFRCTRCRWCSKAGRSRSTAPGSLVTTERCLLNPNRNPEHEPRPRSRRRCASTSVSTASCGWPTASPKTTAPTATSTTSSRSARPGEALLQGCDDRGATRTTRSRVDNRQRLAKPRASR